MASDADNEEDFVTYGVPLEPLAEDEPRKKPVPLHEQTVRDERGRFQRFHGAFTGGFSAGYFNTVGTKEGWAPSTFVSSRQQKAEKQNARPQDFMDEEDLGEHGIAPSEIRTSQEFSSSRTDATRETARAVKAQSASIPGDLLLEQLIAPARSSVGVELLSRMGWREGQGVGPRVKRKAGRQQRAGGSRLYGCVLAPAGSEDSEGEDEEEFAPQDVTFAPKDVTPVDFTPRLGVQGLGYRSLDPGLALMGRRDPDHMDLFRPRSETRSRLFGDQRGSGRGGVAGQAFGVGALEDDDDEEVYHRDSLSRYDTVLGGEEPGDGLYGWTAPQQYTKNTGLPGPRRSPVVTDPSAHRKEQRGLVPGEDPGGLHRGPEPGGGLPGLPPPSLPRDYRPVRRPRPALDAGALSGVSPALAEALRVSRGHMVPQEAPQGGRHLLDSDHRRALLGEDALQGPSSVMELLRPADRQRLLSMRSSSLLTSNTSQNAVWAGPQEEGGGASSDLRQQQEALAVWSGVHTSSQTFRPFEENPSKQARYDLYLDRLKQGDRGGLWWSVVSGGLEHSGDHGLTEWERSRERDEFVRASLLYRPSSSSLSSRFTRATGPGDQDQHLDCRDQDQHLDHRDHEAVVDPQQEAVDMKLFGKLTRETFEWHPDRLLSKRFNTPPPYSSSSLVGVPSVKRDKFSVFSFLTMPSAPLKPPEAGKRSRWDVSDQKKEEEKKKEEEEEEDPLSELLVAARNQTEIKLEPPSSPPSSKVNCKDPLETRSQPGGFMCVLFIQRKTKEEQEEEEEESRPPMDLFKAIFCSSDDESSSSSEGESNEEEEEEEEEEEVKDSKEDPVDPQPLNLFRVTSSPITSSPVTSSQQKAQNSSQEKDKGEEFGPKLPPSSAALTTGGSTSHEEENPGRRSRGKKHKSRKDKKKKKKKEKKGEKKEEKKEEKKRKKHKKEEQEEEVTTQELLKKLRRVQSRETW
ncbi:G patch domain-containing protein 1 isoform X3 [Pseudoliparis swirei]|uniref:G patch domain-containing protein 1 isoform X3 n=1 Tax=Pseudoliparis swirei TaxID=2059687 RepID=UPI0024BE7E2F|nr:G patch domain-containing protein 1 isoform X3 [Pseudoliparis swirei]